MRDKHEPHDAFIDRLESQIAGEIQRRQHRTETPRWAMRSRWKLAVAAIGLALVSMGVGGAVVAAAYQAQSNVQRDLLAASYTLRIGVAQARLALVEQQLLSVQRKQASGMASNDEWIEARIKLAEAESDLKVVQLQFEEVRATGREPLNDISAPLVSGRDFVSDRLRAGMESTRVAVEMAEKQLHDTQTKVEIGIEDRLMAAVMRAKLAEIQTAIETVQRKLEIRQRFVKGEMDATQTDLRVLEAEAEQRLKALKPKIELAEQQLDQTAQRFKVGNAPSVELAEARLKLQQLEADLAKAQLDLAVVRKRLSGKDDK